MDNLSKKMLQFEMKSEWKAFDSRMVSEQLS